MKQKNLILMVVAVGCGLIAAFLTSQMSAKPAAAIPQTEVWVAAKELAPGTKFTKDSIKDQLKKRKLNNDAVPETAIVDEAELDGQTLNKTLRLDDHVTKADLGKYASLLPPDGRDLVTLRMPVDKMTPFVKPSDRIDLLGTMMSKDQKVKGAVLIPNMLVMAVDADVLKPNGGPQGNMAGQMVTLAANTQEAQLIRMSEAANIRLSFILLPENRKSKAADEWKFETIVNWVNDGDLSNADGGYAGNKEKKPTEDTKPKAETVKLPVPTEDLPLGTELTDDVIKAKFKDAEFTLPVPDNAIGSIKDQLGRYLTKDVAANSFVPRNSIGNTNPKAVVVVPPEPKKGVADVEPVTPKAEPPVEPKKVVKKKAMFDRSIITTSGTKVVRYEQQDDGEWKLLGEVTPTGEVVPSAAAPATPAKDDDEKKPTERKVS